MTNAKKTAPVLNKDVAAKLAAMTQTSSKIRLLAAEGMSRGDISRVLGIRYQWVRNVLITPLKNG
jgi:hypothetical protein